MMIDLVDPVTQEGEEWCWAACAVMVGNFLELNPPPTQSDLVQSRFGHATGNESLNGDGIADLYQRGFLGQNISFTRKSGTVEKATIDQALNVGDGDPLQIGLVWIGGQSGHVVLIAGSTTDTTNGETLYLVNDPDPNTGGRRTVPYDGLLNAFGKGTWVETFGAFALA